jgi:hypothetical protein
MDIDPRNNDDLVRVAAVVGLIGGGIRLLQKQDLAATSLGESLGTAIVVAVGAFIVMKGLVLAYDLAVMLATGIANAFLWTVRTAFALFIAIVRGIVLDLPLLLLRMLIEGLTGKKAKTARAKPGKENAGQTSGGNGGSQREPPRQEPPPPPDNERAALELFELSRPYTLGDLKRRRNELMLRVHPDHGGTASLFRQVNEAYDLLRSRL